MQGIPMENLELPKFSVIVCTRNEERYISRCMDSLLANGYPLDRVQVLVCDGRSTDATRKIVEQYAREQACIQLLDNAQLTAPCGFNLGIANAEGDIIAILGAHSEVAPDWIEKNVSALYDHADVAGVGGRMTTVGEGYLGKAISLALSSTFGVGNSSFRVGMKPRCVDTIVFGAYRRTTFDKYGGFDEELSRNQDDEFNYRINSKGGRLWFDPTIKSKYFSRHSLLGLYRQFAQYAFWKPLVLKKCPGVFGWRQLIPPAFVLCLLGFSLLGIFRSTFWWILALIGLLYFAATGFSALKISFRSGFKYILVLPLVFLVLHLAYGLHFLYGTLYLLLLRRSPTPRHASLTR